MSHATEWASLLAPLRRRVRAPLRICLIIVRICQLLCGVVLASSRRALVRRAAGVHRAGGHSRGARTALLLVVLLLTVLCAAAVAVCRSPQTFPYP